jgi:hypothetical protein
MSDLYWLTDEQMDRPRFFSEEPWQLLSGIILVNRNGLRWRDALPPGIRSTQDALQPLECYGDIHPHDAEELVYCRPTLQNAWPFFRKPVIGALPAVPRCSTTCSLTTLRKGSAPHCSHPQKRLLPPWNGISCGFRTHPSRLAWFIANQNVKEGAGKSRNMLLRKQRCDLPPVHGEDEHPSIKISNIKLSFRVR